MIPLNSCKIPSFTGVKLCHQCYCQWLNRYELTNAFNDVPFTAVGQQHRSIKAVGVLFIYRTQWLNLSPCLITSVLYFLPVAYCM